MAQVSRYQVPWVRLAEQNPPLRPEAAQPAVPASSSATSADGSRCRASSAVHSPENPPPTTTRSARCAPASAAAGSGAPGWLVQNERGSAPASARRACPRDAGSAACSDKIRIAPNLPRQISI